MEWQRIVALLTRAALCGLLSLSSVWAGGLDGVPEEAIFREGFEASRIGIRGEIRTHSGVGVSGASVAIVSPDGGVIAVTTAAASGPASFQFGALPRANALLVVTADGYRQAIVPLHLRRSRGVETVMLEPVLLDPSDDGSVRFLFGGDTSFARRFLGWDPDPADVSARYLSPADDPEAFVLASDPEPGSKDVVNFLKPLFVASDYPIVNLESVVTETPLTPHTFKNYVYFTLPDSLGALRDLGIEYVTLGNNHTYDYLEPGVIETMVNVRAAGLDFSGLGRNEAEASRAFREDPARLNGHPYSFISVNGVPGRQSPPIYNATAEKGGAAPLRDSLITGVVDDELAAGRIPIAILHAGKEYTYAPTAYTGRRFDHAARSGAALVVAHHPHIAQGFGFENGVLMVHSLGNLFFDQERLETMYGLLAQVDMRGAQLRRATAIPIYLEDFRPRMMTGYSSASFLRRVAEFSADSALVYPYNGAAQISDDTRSSIPIDRTIVVETSIPASGWTLIDLRRHCRPEESLHSLDVQEGGADLVARPGRDLMIGGDFEDLDLDAEQGETARWFYNGTSGLPVGFHVFRGVGAMCSVRDSAGGGSESVIAYRNRIRVMGDATNHPNKELTLFGMISGENAGNLQIISRYYASAGELLFGEEEAFARAGGSYDWEELMVDLNMPLDSDGEQIDHTTMSARALRLFLRHSEPDSGGRGLQFFDDFAVIAWDETLTGLDSPISLDTPHARDFLRIEGPPGTQAKLQLSLRRLIPVGAAPRGSILISLE